MICSVIYRLANYMWDQSKPDFDILKGYLLSILNSTDMERYLDVANDAIIDLSECNEYNKEYICNIKLLKQMLLSVYYLPEHVSRRDRMKIAFEILHTYNMSCETSNDLKNAARLALDCVYGNDDCNKAYTEIYRIAYRL